MGLFSFLFGGKKRINRGEYNAKVSQIIKDDFGITPDSRVDPRFPGVLAYLGFIDEIYYNDGSPEQAALHLMLPLFGGLRKSQLEKDRSDAALLFEKIKKQARLYLSNGAISQRVLDGYSAVLKKYTGLDV